MPGFCQLPDRVRADEAAASHHENILFGAGSMRAMVIQEQVTFSR